MGKMATLNAVLMGITSPLVVYKYISNKIHISNPHITTAKTQGLISHTQLVHLVNVKRAVIVNYIPI